MNFGVFIFHFVASFSVSSADPDFHIWNAKISLIYTHFCNLSSDYTTNRNDKAIQEHRPSRNRRYINQASGESLSIESEGGYGMQQ